MLWEMLMFLAIVSLFIFKIGVVSDGLVMDKIDFSQLWISQNYESVKIDSRIDPDSKQVYKKYVFQFWVGVLEEWQCLTIWCQNILWTWTGTSGMYSDCYWKTKLCKYVRRFDLSNDQIEIEYNNNYKVLW